MQPIERREEKLDDGDIVPIPQAKELDAQPRWVDTSDQSRNLMGLWDSLCVTEE